MRFLKKAGSALSDSATCVRGAIANPRLAKSVLFDASADFRAEAYTLPGNVYELPQNIVAFLARQSFIAPPSQLIDENANQSYQGLGALVSLGRLVDPSKIFEIGTFNGLTAWCLSANFPMAEVHTLDLPLSATASLSVRPGDRGYVIGDARRYYELLPTDGTVCQHLSDSALFDFSPFLGTVHLVYVDGAHSSAYVKCDSANALAIASPNAVIVWDDVWYRIPEVGQTLATLPLPNLYRVPNTRLVCCFTGGIPALPQ